jgi:hypothetical protein
MEMMGDGCGDGGGKMKKTDRGVGMFKLKNRRKAVCGSLAQKEVRGRKEGLQGTTAVL